MQIRCHTMRAARANMEVDAPTFYNEVPDCGSGVGKKATNREIGWLGRDACVG